MPEAPLNPFRFGNFVIDEFADRATELAEVEADMRNGQDLVIFAPRRLGKSSLVLKAAATMRRKKALVAYLNVMTAPTKTRFAERLASAVYADIAAPKAKLKERALAMFQSLRIVPTITVDPLDGHLSFSFGVGHAEAAIDKTIEMLLELPAKIAAERGRRVVLILDEFQEVVDLDPGFPKLLRSVFQAQPDVCHVYLGSKRHVMHDLFSDANEPFWRSAKQMEIGLIPPDQFARFIRRRFETTNKGLDPAICDRLLGITRGHPYATQELCYSLWEQTPFDGEADADLLARALELVLQSEHAHFSLVWDGLAAGQRVLLEALAREPGRPLSGAYRARHRLAGPSSIQAALKALVDRELVEREPDGSYRVMEPFLTEWLGEFVT
ncbi:MAG TPA: ATP-binding protein [Solirubrobacterales bacterium]|nr:ATP-binding protein [Solirubrobacterales bacterium]